LVVCSNLGEHKIVLLRSYYFGDEDRRSENPSRHRRKLEGLETVK